MHEVGISGEFRAWHQMPDVQGPEAERHELDYKVDMTVTRSELDERGMVWDIDALTEALNGTLSRVEGEDLDTVVGDDVTAVTVEVLARWFHSELCRTMERSDGATLAIRVWESPTAFGGYSAPMISA